MEHELIKQPGRDHTPVSWVTLEWLGFSDMVTANWYKGCIVWAEGKATPKGGTSFVGKAMLPSRAIVETKKRLKNRVSAWHAAIELINDEEKLGTLYWSIARRKANEGDPNAT